VDVTDAYSLIERTETFAGREHTLQVGCSRYSLLRTPKVFASRQPPPLRLRRAKEVGGAHSYWLIVIGYRKECHGYQLPIVRRQRPPRSTATSQLHRPCRSSLSLHCYSSLGGQWLLVRLRIGLTTCRPTHMGLVGRLTPFNAIDIQSVS
jgi:hypothetical protein